MRINMQEFLVATTEVDGLPLFILIERDMNTDYLPIQKELNILPSKSSLVNSPVI
jgi:hypothetical protein